MVDGLELCRKLRAEWTSSFYIIIVTSARGHGNILNALGSGADDYIRKPFDTAELKARVDLGERTFRLHRNLVQTCKAAEKSEGQIRSLLDSADEGIYGVDRGGLLYVYQPRGGECVWLHARRDDWKVHAPNGSLPAC